MKPLAKQTEIELMFTIRTTDWLKTVVEAGTRGTILSVERWRGEMTYVILFDTGICISVDPSYVVSVASFEDSTQECVQSLPVPPFIPDDTEARRLLQAVRSQFFPMDGCLMLKSTGGAAIPLRPDHPMMDILLGIATYLGE